MLARVKVRLVRPCDFSSALTSSTSVSHTSAASATIATTAIIPTLKSNSLHPVLISTPSSTSISSHTLSKAFSTSTASTSSNNNSQPKIKKTNNTKTPEPMNSYERVHKEAESALEFSMRQNNPWDITAKRTVRKKYDPFEDKLVAKNPFVNNVDPDYLHHKERLDAIEKKFSFVDWNRFADHIHRHDVHFFDHDVKLMDSYYDNSLNREKHEAFRHQLKINHASARSDDPFMYIDTKLPFSYIVDSGFTVKVGPRGKRRTAWCLVCQGDQQGTAGFGLGKGDDAVEALVKARHNVLKNIMYVPLFESRTILEPVVGRFGTCRITMIPQPRGSGIKAGPLPYEIFRLFGIQDMTAKVWGTAIMRHQFFSIWQALAHQKTIREVSIEEGVMAWKRFERGTMQPRYPTRAQLFQRSQQIADALDESVKSIRQQINELTSQHPDGLPNKDASLMIRRQLYLDKIGQLMADGVDLEEYGRTEDGKKLLELVKEEYAEPQDDVYWKDFTIPPTFIPQIPHPGIIMPTPVPQRHGGISRSSGVGSTRIDS